MQLRFWVSPDLSRSHKATEEDGKFPGYLVKADTRDRAKMYVRWYRQGVQAASQMAADGDLTVIYRRQD